MPEDAQFLVSSALDYADRRGGRLRAVTVSGARDGLIRLVEKELRDRGMADVEVRFEPDGSSLRLVAVEVDSAS